MMTENTNEDNAETPQMEPFDRGDVLLFTGVFAAIGTSLVVYAVVVGMPHGPLPLVTALLVFFLYESPIVDRYKEALGL